MGIWLCLSMMLLVLALVIAGVFDTASKDSNQQVSVTTSDEDAVYVNATPKPQETTTAQTNHTEQTTVLPPDTTENTTAQTERKALYYVTLSGNKIVLLNEYGEYMDTLHENALFLPKNDQESLRAGIALYSNEEISSLKDDLSEQKKTVKGHSP